MKHPLKFVNDKGLLADALALTLDEVRSIEAVVHRSLAENSNLRELLQAVGELDISDEAWANFLYTYGYWDGGRHA